MSQKEALPTLPAQWVERIFHKMALIYGRDFLRRWDGMDIEEVKADWAQELGRFAGNSEAIRWALAHVPEAHPPTVREFAKLCEMPAKSAMLHIECARAFTAMGKLDAAERQLDKVEQVIAARMQVYEEEEQAA